MLRGAGIAVRGGGFEFRVTRCEIDNAGRDSGCGVRETGDRAKTCSGIRVKRHGFSGAVCQVKAIICLSWDRDYIYW